MGSRDAKDMASVKVYLDHRSRSRPSFLVSLFLQWAKAGLTCLLYLVPALTHTKGKFSANLWQQSCLDGRPGQPNCHKDNNGFRDHNWKFNLKQKTLIEWLPSEISTSFSSTGILSIDLQMSPVLAKPQTKVSDNF